jgi:PAS domain S-box-containing protein
MSKFKLQQFNFRHLILSVTAITIIVMTIFVALISSQIAFNEMRKTLYQQSVHFTRNLAKESVAPLLYDSESGAKNIIDTLLELQQVTGAKVIRITNKPLAQHLDPEHIEHAYPEVTIEKPFNVIETTDGWYFSALVLNELESDNLSDEFLSIEEETAATSLGYVNLGISKSKIYASRQNIFIRNFSISVAAGLILLWIMYSVLRNITRPLEKLSPFMDQSRRGDYVEITEIRGTKEISEMSKTFNQMIQAIKEREQNLSLTLDSIGDAVIATDAKGNVSRMNPVAEQLTGWTFDESKGLPLKDIFSIIDASTRLSIENPVDKVLSTGKTIYLSNHTTLLNKQGKEFQIADSAAPIRDEKNQILGMVLVFNDVTEQYHLRKQIEQQKQRLQGIFDDMKSMVALLDIDGTLTFINNTPLKLVNLKQTDVLGRQFWDLHFFSYDEQVLLRVKDDCLKAADGKISFNDIAISTPRGLFWIEFSVHPVINEAGEVIQLVAEGRDINQRKEQEEALRRSQKMDAIGQLAGGIAHDFNNQLGVVIGYLDILRGTLSDEKQLQWIERSTQATLRSIDLTRQLLAFSRRKSSAKSLVDINTTLNELDTMVKRTVTPQVEVKYFLDNNLWLTEVDSGEFQDVILNIVINARDVMPHGGQLIFETSNKTLDNDDAINKLSIDSGDYIQIIISDTGWGMDRNTLEHIFEPFFTTKAEGKGTGLGLAMVYSFVNRFGGSIRFYSEVNVGTTIRMYLPRSTSTSRTENTSVTKLTLPTGNEHILVVDDEVALLELACEYLTDLGYQVQRADNAIKALEILNRDNSIKALFSDVVMPGGMNGYELADKAMTLFPDMKVLLTSGFTAKANSDSHSLNKNLLSKPYRKTELAKRIRLILDE